jgi:hypothetical protein
VIVALHVIDLERTWATGQNVLILHRDERGLLRRDFLQCGARRSGDQPDVSRYLFPKAKPSIPGLHRLTNLPVFVAVLQSGRVDPSGPARVDRQTRLSDKLRAWEVVMEMLHTALFSLLVAWGVVTVALICLLIYRSAIETKEKDQIFLGAAGQSMANEQLAVVARIERLSRPITALIVVSGSLLAVIAGLWLWLGLQNF